VIRSSSLEMEEKVYLVQRLSANLARSRTQLELVNEDLRLAGLAKYAHTHSNNRSFGLRYSPTCRLSRRSISRSVRFRRLPRVVVVFVVFVENSMLVSICSSIGESVQRSTMFISKTKGRDADRYIMGVRLHHQSNVETTRTK
jgi:hypothetical protein